LEFQLTAGEGLLRSLSPDLSYQYAFEFAAKSYSAVLGKLRGFDNGCVFCRGI
jgi:hypothetical protein